MNRLRSLGRWLKTWFLAPDSKDWAIIRFQPMLYVALWVAAWLILLKGDFASIPIEQADTEFGTPEIWLVLSLLSPPLALSSLWMIFRGSRRLTYPGFWVRLAADVGQFTAMVMYTIMRITVGDYHIYPVACLVASTLFVAHLVIRDVRRLIDTERLATQLHRERQSHGN